MNRKLLMLGLCISLAGVAHAGNKHARIVDEGQLGNTHMLMPGSTLEAPGYPAAYADSRDNVCVALGYTVNADGTTGDFIVLDRWSDASLRAETNPNYWTTFTQAGATAVSQWRFQPREQASAEPVRTVATLTFRGAGSLPDLGDHCRVQNLSAHYQRTRSVRNRLVSDDVTQHNRAAERMIRANEARVRWQAPPPPPPPTPTPTPTPTPNTSS